MYTILIVDDTQLNRKMMIDILRKNIDDVIFLEASNGNEALEEIYEKELSLVILDLNMPEKNGYEVLETLNKDSSFQNLPIIVNSSVTDTEKITYALSLGAVDYFTKSQKSSEMEIIIYTKVKNILRHFSMTSKLAILNKSNENDMNIASIVQRNFLKSQIKFDDVDIYVHYEPLNKLSGDFFATAQYHDRQWVLLVDMKSSSVSLALLALLFRELFMRYAKFCNSPSELMEKLNYEFMNIMKEMDYLFFTAKVLMMENDKAYLSSAGSVTKPVIINEEGIKLIEITGRMIGMVEDSTYSQVEFDFKKGDNLILFTDGIFSKYSAENIDIKKIFEKIYKKSNKGDVKKLTLNIYNEFLDKKSGIKDDLTIACLRKIK